MNRTFILFLNVLIIATCGLIYELQAATLSSFVLGDSVTQFSLIIGMYLSALGVGAWLSRYLEKNLARTFLEVELAVALVGGFSVPMLYLTYTRPGTFLPTLYGTVILVGTLVGLELPLLMRIVQERLEFKELVSRVLTFDYIGALAASVLFPLFFVPQLGLVRTSLFFGILNALVGLWGTWLLRPLIQGSVVGLRVRSVLVLVALIFGLIEADSWTRFAEENVVDGKILFATTTPYQRIVLSESKMGYQLHLNAHMQFSSFDEYRYHEALTHPAMLATKERKNVLILGGGDGLAMREVLRYPEVESVTLVDIDPEMTRLCSTLDVLTKLNHHAYDDSRVTVVNQDALIWLFETVEQEQKFDVVLIDFPDPHSFALGKLYTTRFYRLLAQRLTPDAAIAIQATSPLATRKSYWCILNTMAASGLVVRPYHVGMASFGIWGFALAKKEEFAVKTQGLPQGLRYLDEKALTALFVMPPDIGPVKVGVNRLDNQQLVRYYEEEQRRRE
jgi:spermidine synthase